MDEMYYIYSIRAQAWFTQGAGYDSDIKNAKRWPREEAIAICRNISFGNLGGLPVPESMTQEILNVR